MVILIYYCRNETVSMSTITGTFFLYKPAAFSTLSTSSLIASTDGMYFTCKITVIVFAVVKVLLTYDSCAFVNSNYV